MSEGFVFRHEIYPSSAKYQVPVGMQKRFELSRTAEGRVCISTFSAKGAWKVSLLLMLRYGFYRWGVYIPPLTDEAVYPRFHRGKLKIESGWDHWQGYDWFATNEATDQFLERFYYKHCDGQ